MFRILLVFKLFFYFFSQNIAAQEAIPVGAWRVHPKLNDARTLAVAGEKIYCASETGFFVLDSDKKTSKILSKLDNFSDIGISRLAYYEEKKLLFIAYSNGNIDIFNTETEDIANIRTIFNYRNLPDKRVFDIFFSQNDAWLATAFGIVVIDLDNFSVKEDFSNIGDEGERVSVNSALIFKNRLYAATDNGLIYCDLAGNNLCKDFAQWQKISFTEGKKVSAMSGSGDKFFLGIDEVGFYAYDGNNFSALGLSGENLFFSIRESGENVLICAESGLYRYAQSGLLSKINTVLPENALQADVDAKGNIWAADNKNGLVGNSEGNFAIFTPKGTFFDQVFSLRYTGEKITALAGGFSAAMTAEKNEKGFSMFSGGEWENFNPQGTGKKIPAMKDFVRSVYSTADKKYYFASFGNGILAYDEKNNTFEQLTSDNSPLPNNQIVGLDCDEKGNLWIACYAYNSGEKGFWKKSSDGKWTGYSFPYISAQFPKNLLCDAYGNVLVPLSDILGGGLLVFNEKGESRLMNEDALAGRLVSAKINDLALDLNGNVWLATDKGLNILYFSDKILELSFEAQRPYYKNRPTLSSENITAVAFDGGNRAWIGTNNGIWVFGEDGSRFFENFTSENSPLHDNEIKGIAVNRKSGEVFVATKKGLISHRTEANLPSSDFSEAYAFPNPVKNDFAGKITITGLKNATNVKITDTSGILAYETAALGGTATWDGLNYRGEKVLPGIYFVFCTDGKGEESFVTKIAVLR